MTVDDVTEESIMKNKGVKGYKFTSTKRFSEQIKFTHMSVDFNDKDTVEEIFHHLINMIMRKRADDVIMTTNDVITEDTQENAESDVADNRSEELFTENEDEVTADQIIDDVSVAERTCLLM